MLGAPRLLPATPESAIADRIKATPYGAAGAAFGLSHDLAVTQSSMTKDTTVLTYSFEQLDGLMRALLSAPPESTASFLELNQHLTRPELKGLGWLALTSSNKDKVTRRAEASFEIMKQQGFGKAGLKKGHLYPQHHYAQMLSALRQQEVPFLRGNPYIHTHQALASDNVRTYVFVMDRELQWPEEKPVFQYKASTAYYQYTGKGFEQSTLFPGGLVPPPMAHRIAAYWDVHNRMGSAINSDLLNQSLQCDASHCMEGFAGYERNFNPNLISLEPAFINQTRKFCTLRYWKLLGVKIPNADLFVQQPEAVAQAPDTAAKKTMSRSKLLNEQQEKGMVDECSRVHGSKICRFWNDKWGRPHPVITGIGVSKPIAKAGKGKGRIGNK